MDYGSRRASPAHSVATSLTGSNYIVPIGASCQKNFIVLLTDGEPVSDTGANTTTRIGGMPDAAGRNFSS